MEGGATDTWPKGVRGDAEREEKALADGAPMQCIVLFFTIDKFKMIGEASFG